MSKSKNSSVIYFRNVLHFIFFHLWFNGRFQLFVYVNNSLPATKRLIIINHRKTINTKQDPHHISNYNSLETKWHNKCFKQFE